MEVRDKQDESQREINGKSERKIMEVRGKIVEVKEKNRGGQREIKRKLEQDKKRWERRWILRSHAVGGRLSRRLCAPAVRGG